MSFFIESLKDRNEALFIFGLLNMILSLILVLVSRFSSVEVAGVNAWYKAIKFALSIGIYSWTMAWIMAYLSPGRDIQIVSWVIIVMLGFEIIYIVIQAARGQQSHFNLSNSFYSGMYTLMAFAATVVSLVTAYVRIRFFEGDFTELEPHYLWAIRMGIMLFVIFSLEGFVMGARLSHTIGGEDGGEGLPFLNWSRKYGDPRIAHFIGMHALQLLPILSFYVLKSVRLTFIISALYGLLALYVLVQALEGRPFLKY